MYLSFSMRFSVLQTLKSQKRFCQIRPVRAATVAEQLGESLFHYFHHDRRIPHFRLGYQEMEMFGHHHETDYDKANFCRARSKTRRNRLRRSSLASTGRRR